MTEFLELYGDGDTLADRMRAVARGTVVVDVVKGLLDDARQSLREAADAEQERTGTAFTARLDGVTALVTDPQPKPRVVDQGAFAAWFAEAYPDDVQTVERVEVIDHAQAAGALAALDDDGPERDVYVTPADAVEALIEAIKVVTETVLPEKALDLAHDRGRLHVTDDAVIDVATGEHVPGLTVTKATPTLQVRLDKHARAEATRQVRDVLGIPAELGGAS
jgi:hypothetical protein